MKILLITGHFPPEKSGGIGRPYSLYKYLPENGIDVCVITKDLLSTMPGEKDVLRYGSMWTWRRSPFLSVKVFSKIILSLKNKLYGINYDNWWVKQVEKNINHIEAKHADLIYASFPGPEVLEAALILKNKLQLPLIVEFRDGLAFESLIPNPNILQRRIINNLEKSVIKNSDAVITIGENLSGYFKKKYNKKVYTVFNGYDESDFSEISNTEKKQRIGKIKLIHFGSLNTSRKSDRSGLFHALKNLKTKKVIDKNNFSLSLIGNFSNFENEEISHYGLKDIITFLPYMNKSEGFKYIAEHADYLLFYGVPNQLTIISSKLPEYLRLNKPIIGICKGNEAESIIKKTGTGEVCDFDKTAIELLLLKIINNKVYYQPDFNEIKKFDRRSQTKEIAAIIKNSIPEKNVTP